MKEVAPEVAYEKVVSDRPVVRCQTGVLYGDMYVAGDKSRIEIKTADGKILATLFIQDGEIVGAIIHSMGNEVLNPQQIIQYGNVCNLLDRV